ncbi:MAG: hypothetical protein ACRC8A_06730 [Microcoleaceae cyanobacterium]
MAPPQFDPSSLPTPEGEASLAISSQTTLEADGDRHPAFPRKLSSLQIPKGFWGWQLLWLLILLGFGTAGTGALLWLLTAPPPLDCEGISALSVDGDRLYCVDRAAQSGGLGEIQAAFNLVESWPSTHPLQPQVQQMMSKWTYALIKLANQKIDAGDLAGALALVKAVPKDSPAYASVEEAVSSWQNDWQEGQQLFDKAHKELKARNWKMAFYYIQALTKLENARWSEKAFSELLARLSIEKKGEQRLKEAQEIAKQGNPRELLEAIALANQVDHQLYIAGVAKQEIRIWSRRLLQQAGQALKANNFSEAIKIAELLPRYSPFYQEAQDLILLSRVKSTFATQATHQPFLQQMFILLEGKTALADAKRQQFFNQTAQLQSEDLLNQIQNLVSLQFASQVAKVGHPFALNLAIEQVQMIGPEQPRRVHAQTLVAHWRKEAQRIEDRPYLALARQLAQTETLEGFRAAVAQANQINLGRPLRVEAQTLIAEWAKRVQIIEDQPLLTEAVVLAKEGKLGAAISKAAEIDEGRALYREAQASIGNWVAEIQVVEDRPILSRAKRLASQGSLSAAISEASRIRYGRALYYQAQRLIADWAAERDAIWATQQEQYYRPPSRNSGGYSDGYSDSPRYYDSSSSSGYSEGYSGSSGDSSGYSEPSGYAEPSSSSTDSGFSGEASSPPEPSGGYYSESAPTEPASTELAPTESAPAPIPVVEPESTPPENNLFLE